MPPRKTAAEIAREASEFYNAADDEFLAEKYKQYQSPHLDEFYRRLRAEGAKYTRDQIREFLKVRSVNEHLRRHHAGPVSGSNRANIKYYPIKHSIARPFQRIQVDLADMGLFQGRGQFRYGFAMIDTFSRYGIFLPIKTKGLMDCGRAFNNALDEVRSYGIGHIDRVDCDSESSFNRGNTTPGSFGQTCRENDIEIRQALYGSEARLAHDVRTLAFVDRFIRTIKNRLAQVLQRRDWFDDIGSVLDYYNNDAKNQTTGMTPVDAIENASTTKNEHDARVITDSAIAGQQPWAQVQLNIGDSVRVLENRTTFDKKGHTATWSPTIYHIQAIKHGVYYEVNNKLYRKYELLQTAVEPEEDHDDHRLAVAAERQNQRTATRLRREGLDPVPELRRSKRRRTTTS